MPEQIATGRDGTVSEQEKTRPRQPRPSPTTLVLVWRLAVIALIPVVVLATPNLFYRYVPQVVGGVYYEVRINRFTGHACIVADPAHRLPRLKDELCKTAE